MRTEVPSEIYRLMRNVSTRRPDSSDPSYLRTEMERAELEDRTPPFGVVLPEYEEGFSAGRKRGVADTLDVFRLALIEDGTPPDVAGEMAARLGRKVGLTSG